MSENLIWSVALAVIGILGIYLAGSKNIWGWAVSFGAQAAWIVFAIVTTQYGFILSALAYGFVYGRNFLRWRAERVEARPPKLIHVFAAYYRLGWYANTGPIAERPARLAKANRCADAIGKRLARRYRSWRSTKPTRTSQPQI